jgi:hypothetical protein
MASERTQPTFRRSRAKHGDDRQFSLCTQRALYGGFIINREKEIHFRTRSKPWWATAGVATAAPLHTPLRFSLLKRTTGVQHKRFVSMSLYQPIRGWCMHHAIAIKTEGVVQCKSMYTWCTRGAHTQTGPEGKVNKLTYRTRRQLNCEVWFWLVVLSLQ